MRARYDGARTRRKAVLIECRHRLKRSVLKVYVGGEKNVAGGRERVGNGWKEKKF